ncbi:MAG: GNAT family N-acetyltransferase [Actinomycetota bacterium]|nr:GNAT family N-acetyltransferase [Actinomycetota bacterium]
MSSTTTGGPATASPHPRIYGKSVRPNPGWPSTEVIQTARLTLEPLRVEHADEMAPLLNDPALHSYIGGQPATLEQLRRRYTRQAVGRSVDGAQGWLNWIARHRATAAAVGTVQATLQHSLRPRPLRSRGSSPARERLVGRGVDTSEVQTCDWGSFIYFSDPDGNTWSVQQLPERARDTT